MVSSLAALISLLQRCAKLGDLTAARASHGRLLVSGLFNAAPQASTSLISLYSKLSLPSDATAVFDSSPQTPNLFVWNALLAGLAANSLPAAALHHFRSLRSDALEAPDEFTYPCAIKACADLDARDDTRAIHAELFKTGFDGDFFISSALVHAYLKFGFVDDACVVFDGLRDRDVVLWNAMVTGFAQMGDLGRALEYFQRMVGVEGLKPSKYSYTGILSVFTTMRDLKSGTAIHGVLMKAGYGDDVVVSNSLIDLYGKCELVDEATMVFELMPERDAFSWNSMISACEGSGDHVKTLRLFALMRGSGVVPDPVTVAAVLPGCSQIAALAHGREIHAYMLTSGMRGGGGDLFVDNALMDMYGKCGALEDALKLFDMIPYRDTASWNIIISGLAAHGRGREAMGLFERMVGSGVAPDEVTFIGVLTAYSHAGMVVDGHAILKEMEEEHRVAPAVEHYVCAVDMLGRAGMLEEARGVAEASGNAAAWRAYLAACMATGETTRAVEAASRVVGLEPRESGGYVLLANAYGWVGRYGEVAEVRGDMRRRRVSKSPGCSWVELPGKGASVFVTGDRGLRGHPEEEGMYKVLHGLVGCARESGDVPDVLN